MAKPDPQLAKALEEDPALCVTGLDHRYELSYEDEETTQHRCPVCGAELNTDKETGESW
jgi:hypothetical protein